MAVSLLIEESHYDRDHQSMRHVRLQADEAGNTLFSDDGIAMFLMLKPDGVLDFPCRQTQPISDRQHKTRSVFSAAMATPPPPRQHHAVNSHQAPCTRASV